MKSALTLLALSALAACADPQVPRKVWAVETSMPVAQRLDLVRGETVDLQCKFLSYAAPLDILGASVILHARTNGMAEGGSFQASGTAGSNGLASVRLSVDAWLPQVVTNCAYTLEVAQTNAVRILRASGTAYITGSSSASTSDPLPAVWIDTIRAELVAATGAVWRATTGHVEQAVAPLSASVAVLETNAVMRAGTNGFVTATITNGLATTEGVAAAIAAIPAADAYTVRDTSDTNRFWRFEGTVAVQYEVGGVVTGVLATGAGTAIANGFYWPTEYVKNDSPVYSNHVSGFVYQNEGDGWYITAQGGTDYYQGDFLNVTSLVLGSAPMPSLGLSYAAATNATGVTIGGVPTNLVTQAELEAWWFNEGANWTPYTNFVVHVTPALSPDPHPMYAPTNAPTLLNPRVSGALSILNVMPTNLVARVFGSNDVLYVIWGNQ